MRKIIIILLLSISLFSCNKWLTVDSKDKIMEDKMFSNKENFLSTINGVYLELASGSLYGANLSFGVLDVMGQYYNIYDNTNHRYNAFAKYEWGAASTKNTMGSIWDKSYNMIANLNVIIEKCDEVGDKILGTELNNMIKGEAIALRAMFHFDLLRIFGPIYNTTNSSLKTIPYVTVADRVIVPLSSLDEAINKVMTDLNNAETLLANDPVIKEGQTPSSYNGSTIFAFRQYRLNFFAVKALKARVEQWKGNTAKASEIAEEVINATKELFPFTPADQANHHYFPDRIFSTEMLFGLYHIKRNDDIYKAYFSPDLSINDLLTMSGEYSGGRLDVIFPDQNDFRYKMWAQKTVENKAVLFFNKFEDMSGNSEWSTDSYRYAIPLLTKAELYLIAAEGCSDIKKASEYLSALKNARGVMSVTLDDDNRSSIVIEEFTREMIGKGQLYFLFKRLGMESIPNGSKTDGKMDVDLSIYSIPLPESETSQRGEN